MDQKKILHYSIVRKLGEGGMGSVYLAEDTKLERRVALKFLSDNIDSSDEVLKRFSNEAKLSASLSHPNIAHIYSIEEADGRMFIVLQFIDGQEIDKYLKQEEPPVEEIGRFAREIAEGLQAAHNKGIIHRDIKAGNIMISSEGRVKILDFGLAQLIDQKVVTKDNLMSGTATYLSPELVMGKDASVASDIWAYGVLLYQLFTGDLPFDGVYEQAISYAILDEEPIPAEQKNEAIPEVFRTIIGTCLKKKPEERYSNFDQILETISEAALTPSLPEGTQPQKKFPLPAVLTIALLLIASLVYITFDRLSHRLPSDTQKLAIIPFKNVGDNVENAVLLDGVLETMTSKLSQIDNFEEKLWVIPSSEIINNGINSVLSAQQVFGINLAITGSVQDIEGRKRFTINLIDANDLRQLKSTVIDISGANITRLQTESVLELIKMLEITPTEQINQTVKKGVSVSPEATGFYLTGKGYLRIHTRKDNLDRSISLFRKALGEDPRFASAIAALGESYWYMYELTDQTVYADSAKFYMNQALDIDPDLLAVRQAKGLLELGTGNYEEAIDIYKKITDEQPGNESAYSSLGLAYEYLGDYESAENNYLTAISLKPDYTIGYTKLGEFHLNVGNYAEAVEAFDQVIRITPDSYKAYSNLGVANYYQSDFAKAILNFKRSLELNPNESAASNLGTVYYLQSNYEEAIHNYEIALEVNPNNYAIWGNLASVHGVMGNTDQEQRFYLKAIEVAEQQLTINPRNVSLNSVLGSYYSDVGDTSRAITYIEKTIDLAPDAPDVIFRAASAYENLGRRYRALILMQKAIELEYPIENILNQPELEDLVNSASFEELLIELEIDR